jgi:hypothetical protein
MTFLCCGIPRPRASDFWLQVPSSLRCFQLEMLLQLQVPPDIDTRSLVAGEPASALEPAPQNSLAQLTNPIESIVWRWRMPTRCTGSCDLKKFSPSSSRSLRSLKRDLKKEKCVVTQPDVIVFKRHHKSRSPALRFCNRW